LNAAAGDKARRRAVTPRPRWRGASACWRRRRPAGGSPPSPPALESTGVTGAASFLDPAPLLDPAGSAPPSTLPRPFESGRGDLASLLCRRHGAWGAGEALVLLDDDAVRVGGSALGSTGVAACSAGATANAPALAPRRSMQTRVSSSALRRPRADVVRQDRGRQRVNDHGRGMGRCEGLGCWWGDCVVGRRCCSCGRISVRRGARPRCCRSLSAAGRGRTPTCSSRTAPAPPRPGHLAPAHDSRALTPYSLSQFESLGGKSDLF
jgi:hypothetical protein